MKRPTTKQKLFARAYVANHGNGTDAAVQSYDVDNRNTASSIATENLRKPAVIAEITKWEDILQHEIVPSILTIMDLRDHSPSDHVRLTAAKDLLDRATDPKGDTRKRDPIDLAAMSTQELMERMLKLGEAIDK